MPNPTTYEKIKSLEFSAFELKGLTGWPDPVIEDYLNTIRALATISTLIDTQADKLLEDLSTDFLDGSIPYVDGGGLVEDNTRLKWDSALYILTVGGIISSSGRRKKVTRINTTPYTILPSDEIIMVDTTTIPITVLLSSGISGQSHKIVNCGLADNAVTVTPSGSDLLFGYNASETLFDTENFDITYDSTEGWN